MNNRTRPSARRVRRRACLGLLVLGALALAIVSGPVRAAAQPQVLTVVKTGGGTGTVTSVPAGIDCGVDCTEAYASGTVVSLGAVASVGSVFLGWEGGGCTGTLNCNVQVNVTTTVTARFEVGAGAATLTVEILGTGTGSVTSAPVGINCGSGASD